MNTIHPTGATHHAIDRAREISNVETWRDVIALWHKSTPIDRDTVRAITQRRGDGHESVYRVTPCMRGIMVHDPTTGAIVTVLRMKPSQVAILRGTPAPTPPPEPVIERDARDVVMLDALHAIHILPHVSGKRWTWNLGRQSIRLDRRDTGWSMTVKGPRDSFDRVVSADDVSAIALIRRCFVAT